MFCICILTVQKIQTSRQTEDALFVYGDIYSITERGVVDIFVSIQTFLQIYVEQTDECWKETSSYHCFIFQVHSVLHDLSHFNLNVWRYPYVLGHFLFCQGIGKVKTYFLGRTQTCAKIPGKTGRPHGILKMK